MESIKNSIKYFVTIPEWWWELHYKGYEELKSDQRSSIRKKEFEAFEKVIKEKEAPLNLSNTRYALWEVETIDNTSAS